MQPCTAKDLLKHASAILESLGLQGIRDRTLRYYIQNGVVPPPIGSPKFARYDFRHLQGLVTARALQNQGMKLMQIRSQMAPSNMVRERRTAYGDPKTTIELSQRVRLEFDDDGNMEEDLKAAYHAVRRILERIGKEEKWNKR